jgi:anti-sigma B factor antagonist
VFEVEVTEQDSWTVVMPVGDLDLSSAPALRRHLIAAIAATEGRVVVDLAGVHLVDSQGLGTLVGGLKRARSHGGDLRLASPPPDVVGLLELTGLDRAFVVTAEVAGAVQAPVAPTVDRDHG